MADTGLAAAFSPDYARARSRFRDAALGAGARLDALPVDRPGPDGGALAIDLAWLGDAAASTLVVHVSGTHGVEGFAGSAIQSALLEGGVDLPSGAALLLVHALNPYGMAWLRRVNEYNVDLNRNVMPPGTPWSGAPDAYARLDPLLNPRSPPGPDLFCAHAAWQVLRHGFGPLRQAIAGGQHGYPKGLFYGGAELQPGPAGYLCWLEGKAGDVERCLVIDVHTGLGRRGAESLFLRADGDDSKGIGHLPGRRFVPDPALTGEGYAVQGGHSNLYARLPGSPRVDFVTQEFGTYPGPRILHALREENRWHHWGGGGVDHPARRRLLEMFAPREPAWRAGVVERGLALARDVLALGA